MVSMSSRASRARPGFAGETLLAALVCGLFFVLSSGTVRVPPNDFALAVWNPGQQLLQTGSVTVEYPYPLWTLILALPLALGNAETGALIWLGCNLAMLGASVALILRVLDLPRHPLMLLAVSASVGIYTHVYTGLWLGQLIFISLVTLLASVWCIQRGRWGWAGIWMAVGLLKPQVTVLVVAALLLIAVWERRWRFLAGFAAVMAAFVVIAAPFAAVPRQIIGGGVGAHLTTYLAHTSTLWGLSLTLFPHAAWLPAIIAGALFVWIVWLWFDAVRRHHWIERSVYLVIISTLVNLIIIPYSWSYNQVMLAFPLVYAAKIALRLPLRGRMLAVIGIVVIGYVLPPLLYTTLMQPRQSDVFGVIPLLLFLPFMATLHYRGERSHWR